MNIEIRINSAVEISPVSYIHANKKRKFMFIVTECSESLCHSLDRLLITGTCVVTVMIETLCT